MTLKNKSLYSLYSTMKVRFSGVDLESMILSESGKAKVQQANTVIPRKLAVPNSRNSLTRGSSRCSLPPNSRYLY